MKERASTIFPFVVAAALPLAGLVLAAAWALDKRPYDAALAAASSVLGALLYLILLGT
jgi:hypothetical protein